MRVIEFVKLTQLQQPGIMPSSEMLHKAKKLVVSREGRLSTMTHLHASIATKRFSNSTVRGALSKNCVCNIICKGLPEDAEKAMDGF
jgi:hypothetical protein